jgi:hypothetical protein
VFNEEKKVSENEEDGKLFRTNVRNEVTESTFSFIFKSMSTNDKTDSGQNSFEYEVK